MEKNYTNEAAITKTIRLLRIEAVEVTQHVEEQPAQTLDLNEHDFKLHEYPAAPKDFKFWPLDQVNPSQVGHIIAARRPGAFSRW